MTKEEFNTIIKPLSLLDAKPRVFMQNAILKNFENWGKEAILRLNGVSGSANEIINYIENEAEIAIPINELMHEEGKHLTKKEYGHVLLKFLVKELREHYH